MERKKVYIKNFGCQMNKLDAGLVISSLTEKLCQLTDTSDDADVVLLNTCSVRQRAEEKVFSHLGHLKHQKQTNPGLIVVVFGCMAQRLGQSLLEHPAVDIVVGPAQIPQISQLIEKTLNHRQKLSSVTEKIRKPSNDISQELEKFESVYDNKDKKIPAQAFVRAMRGCDKFCTYCIVPYVRGPEISRPPEAIINQVRHLADNGTKQITLLGQTINRYRYQDSTATYHLADLLNMLCEVEKIQWIRFITSHPADFDRNILKAIAGSEKICPYLHIPAQSGSNKILKAMNRDYTVEQYYQLLEDARSIVPDIAISSDFIVGFPGETEDDFEQTAELIKNARFKNSFIFKYSPRPGTTAVSRLEDSVDDSIKKHRNIKLLDIQNQISQQDNLEMVGKIVKVLVEGLSKKPHLNTAENMDMPQLIARTAQDHIVVFNGPAKLAGDFAEVKITKAASLTLFGNLI